MFDRDQVKAHQEFIKEQRVRKEDIGKPRYPERKFWEEMTELLIEIRESQSRAYREAPISVGWEEAPMEFVSENFINEVGDFLFCLLGDPALAEQLQARLEFDRERAERYKEKDFAVLRG